MTDDDYSWLFILPVILAILLIIAMLVATNNPNNAFVGPCAPYRC